MEQECLHPANPLPGAADVPALPSEVASLGGKTIVSAENDRATTFDFQCGFRLQNGPTD